MTFVGNVDPQEVFKAVEARLGSWRKVGGPPVEATQIPRRNEAKRVEVFVPAKSSADILMGEQGDLTRLSDDYYPSMLANYIVGGGANSRLFATVRNELGLTYGVGSGFSAAKLAGPWTVSLTVNPNAIDKAIKATHDVLAEWREKGVTAEELADAKTSIAGLFQVGLATNGGLAGVLTTYETLGLGAEFVTEHPKRIAAVKLDDVNAAIRKHFDPDVFFTVVSGTVPKS
jgi:zinc protease